MISSTIDVCDIISQTNIAQPINYTYSNVKKQGLLMEVTIMTDRIITEPAQDVKILTEAEVVVVGGGPGGPSAAIAAARNGAKTVLVERYGHLGGVATGGIVIQIPHMSDGTEEQQIVGLTQEWIDRLGPTGGGLCPRA